MQTQPSLDILPPLIEGVAAGILGYAVLLAAIATITMALLELVKALVAARYFFHRSFVKKWMGSTAFSELEGLCAPRGEKTLALFELPTDQMIAHIRSAAGVAVDFPTQYTGLFSFFTETAVVAASESVQKWKTYSASKVDQQWDKDAIQARSRIDHFVSRRLDAFQIHCEYWWARWNQFAAVLGGAIFIYLSLQDSGMSALQVILLSIFGGLIAPFAKDVVSALIGLRGKTP